MKIKELPGKGASQGFSLIELLIVVAILGILAVTIGFYITTSSAKLKTFVFNTKARFNQARFEAVKRSRNVYLDFDFYTGTAYTTYAPDGIIDNGFTLWVDDDGSEGFNAGDSFIGAQVLFDNMVSGGGHGPEIYCNACGITGGPGDDGPGLKTVGDGVTAGAPKDRFRFEPDGDSSDGLVYFYFPQGPSGAKSVKYGPWAIIVNSVGRIKIDQWKSAAYGWEVNNPN